MTERILWQSVVFQAFMDATCLRTDFASAENVHAQRAADAWIRGCGSDFRRVCAYADLDPGFLSRAYVQGRVDPARLRAPSKAKAQVTA